jgi:putative transcriptional regulator
MAEPAEHRIEVHLDELLAARGKTLVELSARVGVTVANLSILKNGHARAIRFSTLTAICDALDCTPGELLTVQDTQPSSSPERAPTEGPVAASP